MPDLKINNQNAIDLLIYWVTGIDRNLGFKEIKDVGELLEEMRYDPTELGERTINKFGSSGPSENIINEAKEFALENFDDRKKANTVHLLEWLAQANGEMTNKEKSRIQELSRLFSV